jgi:hypothetical protein
MIPEANETEGAQMEVGTVVVYRQPGERVVVRGDKGGMKL